MAYWFWRCARSASRSRLSNRNVVHEYRVIGLSFRESFYHALLNHTPGWHKQFLRADTESCTAWVRSSNEKLTMMLRWFAGGFKVLHNRRSELKWSWRDLPLNWIERLIFDGVGPVWDGDSESWGDVNELVTETVVMNWWRGVMMIGSNSIPRTYLQTYLLETITMGVQYCTVLSAA